MLMEMLLFIPLKVWRPQHDANHEHPNMTQVASNRPYVI
jgi:hypothetical protein